MPLEERSAKRAKVEVASFLSDNVPPMGIYETIYAVKDSWGAHMGTAGTHPWSQGFPLTVPLEKFDGPELPSSVNVTPTDRFYPKADGHPDLKQAIVAMYNDHHGTSITTENVMCFAGGRAAIYTVLQFLKNHVEVYTPTSGTPG